LEVGLWFAAKVNYLEGVKYFLRKGASHTGEPLYVAARFNGIDTINFLIESGREFVDEEILSELVKLTDYDRRIDMYWKLGTILILRSAQHYPDADVREHLWRQVRRLTPR
jgi:hypothetical protein